MIADHPHTDPGDGREECPTCGKWVWLVIHSCKGVPVAKGVIGEGPGSTRQRHKYDGERCTVCGCNWFDVSFFREWDEDWCAGRYRPAWDAAVAKAKDPS